MTKRLLAHMRSNVVAYVALFFALGTTGAWAAGQITSKDIKDGTIKSVDVKDHGLKVKDEVAFSGSVTFNFGSIGSNSCQSIDLATSKSVKPNDWVVTLPDTTVSGDASWIGGALQASLGPTDVAPEKKLTLRACNGTGANFDPPSTKFRYLVLR
jgi:hypothetical protein